MPTGSSRRGDAPLPFLLLIVLACTTCSQDESAPPTADRGEGICLTFSADDVPGWSACLPNPATFVPEALSRMDMDRCLEAWDALDESKRDALIDSGRIHADRRCRFTAGPGTPAAAALVSLGRPVNLNSATIDDLQALPGVGPALAERILASRHAEGPFCTSDDLTRVTGIGPKTLEKLRPYLSASCK